AMIEAIAGLGYMVPTSRGLSVRAFLSRDSGAGREAISLLPSTSGDPLLQDAPAPALEEVYASAALVETMGIAAGDIVLVRTVRQSSAQIFEAPVRVLGVIPATSLPGARLLVHPQLVEELESFLEGYAITRLDLAGTPQL